MEKACLACSPRLPYLPGRDNSPPEFSCRGHVRLPQCCDVLRRTVTSRHEKPSRIVEFVNFVPSSCHVDQLTFHIPLPSLKYKFTIFIYLLSSDSCRSASWIYKRLPLWACLMTISFRFNRSLVPLSRLMIGCCKTVSPQCSTHQ